MNWKPIAGAALDGTAYDLWVTGRPQVHMEKGPVFRIANCKFLDGYWREYDNHHGWKRIGEYTPTHYCEITPPQEPIDWPDNGGWWWCKYDGVVSMHQVMLMYGNPKIGRSIKLSGIVNYEEDLIGWKFIRAIPPSFGDAP